MFWGWKFLEAESVSRPKLSRGWKCLPTVLGAESFSRLKVSPSWKFLEAASVSGLKVSPGWKFLGAASVSGLKLSQLKVSQGWKCLSPSWLKVSGGWKCLGCKFLAMEIVSGLKVSSRPLRVYWCIFHKDQSLKVWWRKSIIDIYWNHGSCLFQQTYNNFVNCDFFLPSFQRFINSKKLSHLHVHLGLHF